MLLETSFKLTRQAVSKGSYNARHFTFHACSFGQPQCITSVIGALSQQCFFCDTRIEITNIILIALLVSSVRCCTRLIGRTPNRKKQPACTFAISENLCMATRIIAATICLITRAIHVFAKCTQFVLTKRHSPFVVPRTRSR